MDIYHISYKYPGKSFFKIAGALLCHLRKRSNCTSRAEANITTTQTMHTTKYNTTATWEKS
jgi:hypothetical protein